MILITSFFFYFIDKDYLHGIIVGKSHVLLKPFYGYLSSVQIEEAARDDSDQIYNLKKSGTVSESHEKAWFGSDPRRLDPDQT